MQLISLLRKDIMEIVIELPRDINKLCRTCMSFIEDSSYSVEIVENCLIHNNQLTELSKMLENITSLKVSSEDGLPESLCSRCIEHLKLAYTFKNQCISVAANLRNLINIAEHGESIENCDVSSELSLVLKNPETLEKDIKQIEFTCQICQKITESRYDLSKHMINHNTSKNLLERLLDDNSIDSKITVKDEEENYHTTNNESLIKERKAENITIPSTIVDKNNLNGNDNKEQIQNISDFSMDCDNTESILEPIGNKTSKKLDKKVEVTCRICSQNFESRKALISHICTPLNIETKNNLTMQLCSLCDKNFSDAATLSLHFLSHTFALEDESRICVESEFFFCEVCGQTFETNILLISHYNETHSGKPTWSCTKCQGIYEKEHDLIRHDYTAHKYEHTEKSDVPCVLCNQMFPTKAALLVHFRVHLMKKYACRKCSLSFCTQQSYFSHLKSHPGYQYTCSTCGKHLSTKSALKSHIVGVHSVELHHTCSTCGKRFSTAARLKTHSLIHTSHKKYVCSYCGYSAHKIGDLQIHTRTHTSERPYKCTFANCTMSFKTSSHLCDHIRRHLQIRKFKCSICSMGFTTNHGLKIHHMQHTGEKPHSCLICHQKFRRKYHVTVHMKQHNRSDT